MAWKSRDFTSRRCGARVVDVKVRGYGAALYHATLAARGNLAHWIRMADGGAGSGHQT